MRRRYFYRLNSMEILQNGISYFLCAKLSQAEICTCGDFSLARPHHFEEMPVWWNEALLSGQGSRLVTSLSEATPTELGYTDAKYLMIFCILHSGLRNRGGSMRVQVSPQVLSAKHTEYACNPCFASIGYASHNASSRCSDCRLLRNR